MEILHCSCKHEFQDERYGVGMRAHNPRAKDGEFICTVCGKIQNKYSGAEKKSV